MKSNNIRQIEPLTSTWKFHKADPEGAALPACDDTAWEDVVVPHDWAIAGPFDRNHDIQITTIFEDGEEKPAEHTGRTGALPHVGVGWYRRWFSIPQELQGRRVFVEFDGVMSYSKVFVNGELLGSWPFGYSSFCFEITDRIKAGQENLLAVRAEVKPFASRWYPGAGLYRNVRLLFVHPIHVAHWGTYITTPEISENAGQVNIRTEIQNQSGQAEEITLRTDVAAPDGEIVGSVSSQITINESTRIAQQLRVKNPLRWDVSDPRCYKVVSQVLVQDQIVDRYETTFGFRTLRFDANDGFFLNERSIKLKGVCMHHDLGPLGAALNLRALERQYTTLKQMGCNAIRTSHNPPAPELLDLCDRMGFVVIDEAFDEWQLGKVDNGYHRLFDEWAEKDLRAMIRRDRNHPCIIMWSIGNEILEQGKQDGAQAAKFLTDICHAEDPSRPVTAGFNNPEGAIEHGLADVVDIPGWNYKPHLYERYHQEHPDWIMYGSETESCVSTRGEYYFPVEEERDKRRETLQCSSYDIAGPAWGYSPDREFAAQEDCPFMLGEFVWTGSDYLGEPTPYKNEWPSRSSYFGIIDLCGFPKDRYYLYQSHWSDKPVLHLLPHWNWAGREGEVTPVHCYTSYRSAELFLNGTSCGIRRKDPDSVFDRYRLRWNDIRYEPGILKVVAFDDTGNVAAEHEIRTAGEPAGIELVPDRKQIKADGRDLTFITVRIVDADGTLCPLADNRMTFTVEGPGKIMAVANGDPTNLESFITDSRNVFHGLCLLIISAINGESEAVRITASSEGLPPVETKIPLL